MSAIAEWYLLPTGRIPELNAVCQPTKRSWWRAPARDYDAFWRFLDTHATSGPGLEASGWVMNPLLLYLQESLAVPVDAAERHPLVATIAIDTFLVIEPAAGEAWRRGLDAALGDLPAVEAYLGTYYGDQRPLSPDDTKLHVAALRYLLDGVSRLTDGSVLLLSIG